MRAQTVSARSPARCRCRKECAKRRKCWGASGYRLEFTGTSTVGGNRRLRERRVARAHEGARRAGRDRLPDRRRHVPRVPFVVVERVPLEGRTRLCAGLPREEEPFSGADDDVTEAVAVCISERGGSGHPAAGELRPSVGGAPTCVGCMQEVTTRACYDFRIAIAGNVSDGMVHKERVVSKDRRRAGHHKAGLPVPGGKKKLAPLHAAARTKGEGELEGGAACYHVGMAVLVEVAKRRLRQKRKKRVFIRLCEAPKNAQELARKIGPSAFVIDDGPWVTPEHNRAVPVPLEDDFELAIAIEIAERGCSGNALADDWEELDGADTHRPVRQERAARGVHSAAINRDLVTPGDKIEDAIAVQVANRRRRHDPRLSGRFRTLDGDGEAGELVAIASKSVHFPVKRAEDDVELSVSVEIDEGR
ncbi:hypothetical protein OUZ56_032428 [Daphnia magna]|uniref:Uncharacterized protein n=1 Tax=Daphnia magna TaxID=35525 RepID=A0ABR0B8V3_9CRUS|nr:hypothetical protein OUZ56_032428 [Daphnia magna]